MHTTIDTQADFETALAWELGKVKAAAIAAGLTPTGDATARRIEKPHWKQWALRLPIRETAVCPETGDVGDLTITANGSTLTELFEHAHIRVRETGKRVMQGSA